MRVLPVIAATLGVLLLCPATTDAKTAAPPAGLRVMTYNIQHGAGLDDVFNLDRTIAAIAAEHPDVVALQEVDDHWGARSDNLDEPAVLAAKLHLHAFFAQIYDLPPGSDNAPDAQYGLTILSRYPILDAQNHQITRLSTVATNPSPADAPGFPEIAIRVGGRLVHIYDTHLDSTGNPAIRAAQVADMLKFLTHDTTPKLLLGDFNAGPTAPELAPLLAAQHDAWAVLGQPHPPTWPSGAPTDVNDYVTVSPGWTVLDVRTVDTQASDHRPVVADLALS
jgi:endonuclease/exonuclease/phosphatase family metal-dependent hydrolase